MMTLVQYSEGYSVQILQIFKIKSLFEVEVEIEFNLPYK